MYAFTNLIKHIKLLKKFMLLYFKEKTTEIQCLVISYRLTF